MEKFHVFAICAYHDSPYLEACIRSVTGQSVLSCAILCTSTPSPYIEGLAEKYRLPLYVREGKGGIQADWNFAFEKADARFATIAHQDDLYGRDYVKTLAEYAERFPDISLFATDYVTVRGRRLAREEQLALVKKMLRIPLRMPWLNHKTFIKKMALRFGNSICCPACTYRKDGREGPLFRSLYEFALDWDHLLTMAEEPGRFICVERPLMFHRLHGEAATNACMKKDLRQKEEEEIFKRLWPRSIARLLMRFYRKAWKSYEL